MSLIKQFLKQSVTHLVRIACMFALIGLALMVYGVLVPKPLNVIMSLSFGHLCGFFALAFYLWAVLLDASRKRRRSMPPPPREH